MKRLVPLLFGALLIAGCSTTTSRQTAWEYDVRTFSHVSEQDLKSTVSNAAKDRWEVVSTQQRVGDTSLMIVLRRPKR
jgi:PBP1b-binding outer membrane lipoprotein LpoB